LSSEFQAIFFIKIRTFRSL